MRIWKLVMVGGTALILASAAQAEGVRGNWTCIFDVECFEQEACGETDYEVAVSYDLSELKDKPGHGAGTGTMIDQVATRQATILHDNGAFFANSTDVTSDTTIAPEMFQMFVATSGDARLISVTPSEPLLITYYGTCQDAG